MELKTKVESYENESTTQNELKSKEEELSKLKRELMNFRQEQIKNEKLIETHNQ